MTKKSAAETTIDNWRTILASISASLIGYFVITAMDTSEERELAERMASVETELRIHGNHLDRIERRLTDGD